MESIDWDIYAKSYEDTQHLLGRPDLAQKHYDMIGKDQGRDAGFDATLLYCTALECPSEESAKSFYLNAPTIQGLCRSRQCLIDCVRQHSALADYMPENTEYVIGPVVDELLFSLYLGKQKRALADVVDELVQRITEELIGDLALKAPPTVPASGVSSPGAPVLQRPAAVKIASRRNHVLQLDCVVTLGEPACHVLIGTCIDPDHQIDAVRLCWGDRRIDVTQQIISFVRPARAAQILAANPALDLRSEPIGFAILLNGKLVGGGAPDGLEVEALGESSTLISPQTQDPAAIDQDDLRSFWSAAHSQLSQLLARELSALPAAWLQKILPERASPSNPVQFSVESFYSFDNRQILIANLRDPQHRLKAVYLSQRHGAMQLLDDCSVRGLGAHDENGPREYFLSNSPAVGLFDEEVVLFGLMDHGQWFRIERTVQPATADMLLRDLVRIFETLQGKVFDRVYDQMVKPVVDALFAPQTFNNPAYLMQALGETKGSPNPPECSALVFASALHRNLVAQVSQLELAAAEPGKIEVLLYLEQAPSAKALDFYLRQLAWFNINIRIFSAPAQQGFGRTLNQLAAQARGNHLLLLGEQVLPITPKWLKAMEQHLGKEDVAIVLPLSLNVGGTVDNGGFAFELEQGSRTWRVCNELKSLPLKRMEGCAPYNVPFGLLQAALVRKAGFERLGGVAEDLHGMDLCSIDYCLRVHAQGKKIMLDPSVHFQVLPKPANVSQAGQGRSELLKRYKSKVLNQRWASVIEEQFTEWRVGSTALHPEQNARKGVLDILKGLR
ncbi:MAG TPA: hypothetical protein VFV39_09640 [Limnobacter sp.]|nr:hypothetical protein [Limnobacter sp.]